MPNKPSLVINTSPLVALAAALDDFQIVGEVATLVVPREVLLELDAGAERDETAGLVRTAKWCVIRAPFPALPPELSIALGERGDPSR